MNNADILRVPCGPGTLHVERYGYGGAPVVMLHGFATSSFLWRHVGPLVALRQHCAYAIDMLGYGESDRPFAADYGVRAQADAIDNALTALRIPRATVVGVDIGAVVAMRLAHDQPRRVERLVLISPTPLSDLPGVEIRDLQRSSARHAISLSGDLMGAMPLFRDFFQGAVGAEGELPPKLIGRYMAPFLGRDGLDHLLGLARALEGDDVVDMAPTSIGQPVRVIRGTRDRRCERGAALGLADAFRHGEFIELPEGARLLPEEAPEAVAELCLRPPVATG